jgi:uncharacterized membrane protein YgaE (UPF0421/DUF939 family)
MAATATPDELAKLLQQLREEEQRIEYRAKQLAALGESRVDDEALQQEFVSLCADTLRRNVEKVEEIIALTSESGESGERDDSSTTEISEQDLDAFRQQLATMTDEEAGAFLEQLGF